METKKKFIELNDGRKKVGSEDYILGPKPFTENWLYNKNRNWHRSNFADFGKLHQKIP
jgi:hypothetical protein